MAENVWTGATQDGLWSTGANWTLGTEPADDEDVVLNGTAVGSILDGFPAATGEDVILNSFTRAPEYTGDVGSATSPCRFATVNATSPINPLDNTGKAIVQGPGKFFFEAARGVSTDERVDWMYIDTDNQADEIELSSNIANLSLIKGNIKALAGLSNSVISVSYKSNPTNDVLLTIEMTSGIGTLVMNGGIVNHTGSGIIGALYVNGGVCDLGPNVDFITALTMTSGTVVRRSTAIVIFARVVGGTLDYSQDSRAKTITTLRVHRGGVFLNGPNVTINDGGSILPLTDIIP